MVSCSYSTSILTMRAVESENTSFGIAIRANGTDRPVRKAEQDAPIWTAIYQVPTSSSLDFSRNRNLESGWINFSNTRATVRGSQKSTNSCKDTEISGPKDARP